MTRVVGAIVATGVVLVALLAFNGSRPGNSPSMELAAHVPYEMGGDIQFQRRSGLHLVDGASLDATTDLLFASAHADITRVDGGIEIFDITSPAAPRTLTRIPCPGYQSDVAVHKSLLLQALDHPRSNVGCDPEWLRTTGSTDIDRAGHWRRAHLRRHRPRQTEADPLRRSPRAIRDGVHDVTVLPWAGVAYLAQLDGRLGVLDLKDPAAPYVSMDVDSMSPEMKTSCHDVGLDPVRLLAFCPAMEDETYILDVSAPMDAAYEGKVTNAALSRHHGALMAPDGATLVLQSEYDHPPGVASDAAAGLWFYDLSDPTSPMLLGSWAPKSCEPSEQAERACSSHWYNFVPGTHLLVSAWRHEGVFVVDYSDPAAPVEIAYFRPTATGLPMGDPTDFWTAYYWHGYVYGSANRAAGGLYVLRYDPLADTEPSPYDEGTSWGRWSSDGEPR